MSEPSMEKRTVLIVEDDKINRLMLQDILQDQYDILFAENGQIALEVLRKHGNRIAVILLDIQMPVMDGYEFLKIVGQDAVYSKIPVIVTTVLDRVEEEARCLELGALDFIVKPYNSLIVQLRVENIIRLRERDGIISELELDALTGYKTRKAYYKDIESIEKDSQKSQLPVGLVFTDVNGLKKINDSQGHEAGDNLLVAVVKDINATFPDASKYRLGGDEFVILSFDPCEADFQQKISRLTASWDEDHSAAVGSVWLDHADTLEKNVARADKMMYQDKSSYYERQVHDRRRTCPTETDESMQKVAAAAELLPCGFFIYHADENKELITYNQELIKIFRCKNDQEFIELTDNSFRNMVHPEDRLLVEADISSQIKGEKDIDRVTYRIICKDGSEKRVLDYGRFVHSELYGDVYYVLILENDVLEEVL